MVQRKLLTITRMTTIKEAKLQGFEKAIKVIYELSRNRDQATKDFIEEFARIHEVELKK